jgi:hypothetical protein
LERCTLLSDLIQSSGFSADGTHFRAILSFIASASICTGFVGIVVE